MPGADGDDATTDVDSDANSDAAADVDTEGASERDGGLRNDLADTLAGRRNVVAVGVDLDVVPAVLAARRRTDGGCWRIACRLGLVDELGRT
ncbi:hypothetical protein ACFQEU_16160, partial [Halorubrum tibetense]